ncbi:serine/threonine phosphatase [Kovacikia minuta CCNUW1]|uniref:serine/threonine phosphatase n=1 Tax=Kovacikia minuta TaxID=2931930 RepID=UPI001CCEFDA5|nr:serine/threonine phosphatase [Kovacikia minuta]UBF27379.1 serine/threonine phosphatase [Kovacikia minuta CCNUW1]
MLVCPQCQFENPNINKFCQECGTSLTQNTCPECNRLVPFNAVNCQACGTISGVTWWAILVGTPASAGKPLYSETSVAGEVLTVTSWLDAQKRYQILEALSAKQDLSLENQFRVLDCQPFQLSLLETLTKQEETAPSPELPNSPDFASNPLVTSNPVTSVTAMIPTAIAQPYLALQEKYCHALPVLHDAWQQEGQQILLLEDRSQFPLLLDLWLNEDLELPQLQVLHWLYEMVELWNLLEPLNYQQSLLETTNLHVDEDQAICLQRLWANSAATPLTLQDLGRFWQQLFTQSKRTQFGSISLLLAELEAGQLNTVTDLRSYIEAIAHELQTNQLDVETTPELETMKSADLPINARSTETEATTMDTADVSASVAPTRLEIPPEDVSTLVDDDGELDSDDLPTVVLPMQLFNLEDAGRTDIGRQRDHNEDYFGIETQVARLESPSGKTVHARNLYVLCDGMGGHAGGEVASALAVDTLRQFFQEKWQNDPFLTGSNKLPGPDVLTEAVQLANKAIYDVNQQNARSGSGRMGTTLVMLLVQDTEVAIAHVGDSRLYRYTRKRGLEQITIDHEVGQREIQRGVEPDIAYARPDAYQLTQALGPRDEHFIKPDVQYLELNEDALLLLCSDGLSDNDLLEKHYKTHLEPLLSSQANLEQGVSQLIDLANQYNGHDNITAIAIRAKVRPNLEHLR